MLAILLAAFIGGTPVQLTSHGGFSVEVSDAGSPVKVWTTEVETVDPQRLPDDQSAWWEGYRERVRSLEWRRAPVLERELTRELLGKVGPEALVMLRRWLFQTPEGQEGELLVVVLPSGATLSRIQDLETGASMVVGVKLGDERIWQHMKELTSAKDEESQRAAKAALRRAAAQGEIVCQVGSERRHLPPEGGSTLEATILSLRNRMEPREWTALSRWLALAEGLQESSCVRPRGRLPWVRLAFQARQLLGDEPPAEVGECRRVLAAGPSLGDPGSATIAEWFGHEAPGWPRIRRSFARMFSELAQ